MIEISTFNSYNTEIISLQVIRETISKTNSQILSSMCQIPIGRWVLQQAVVQRYPAHARYMQACVARTVRCRYTLCVTISRYPVWRRKARRLDQVNIGDCAIWYFQHLKINIWQSACYPPVKRNRTYRKKRK